jgi:2-methylcitrate dehydratase PrpD
VRITLRNGRVIREVQEHNLGSPENPMSDAQLRAKFEDNAAAVLDTDARDRLASAIAAVDDLDDVSVITGLAVESTHV